MRSLHRAIAILTIVIAINNTLSLLQKDFCYFFLLPLRARAVAIASDISKFGAYRKEAMNQFTKPTQRNEANRLRATYFFI